MQTLPLWARTEEQNIRGGNEARQTEGKHTQQGQIIYPAREGHSEGKSLDPELNSEAKTAEGLQRFEI